MTNTTPEFLIFEDEDVRQESYLEAIENTLEEVRNGNMEFVSININREIKTIKDGDDVIDMQHTGVITLEITLRPARKP